MHRKNIVLKIGCLVGCGDIIVNTIVAWYCGQIHESNLL